MSSDSNMSKRLKQCYCFLAKGIMHPFVTYNNNSNNNTTTSTTTNDDDDDYDDDIDVVVAADDIDVKEQCTI